MTAHRCGLLLLVAVLVTGLNAVKPLHIDSPIYYEYGLGFASDPIHPYNFQYRASLGAAPAHQIMIPPCFLYWLATGIHLLGDNPVLLKLWLFPLVVLLVFSLHDLFRRFAPGMERPLLCMTILSPVLLPNFDLFLDIPTLALSLASLSLFCTAVERKTWWMVVAAGVVAGSAMQTKYSALVLPGILLIYAFLQKRPGPGLLAGLVAVGLFVSWECYVATCQGSSHFLLHAGRQNPGGGMKKVRDLIVPLIGNAGGVCVAGTLLGLVALRWSRRQVLAALGGVACGFLLLTLIPPLELRSGHPHWHADYLVRMVLFGILGLLWVVTVAQVMYRLGRLPGEDGSVQIHWSPDRGTLFLLLWFGLEVAGSLVLSPFPASRRTLGVTVVSMLLVGRLASRVGVLQTHPRLVQGIAGAGVLLTTLFCVVEFYDARAGESGSREALTWIRQHESHPRVWHFSWHGFSFYADRLGMNCAVVGESSLRRGDWVVVPDPPFAPPGSKLVTTDLSPASKLSLVDPVPLRTILCYYAGRTPLEHLHGPRLTVTIYHVDRDTVLTLAQP